MKPTGEPCDLVLISDNRSWKARIPNDKVRKHCDSAVLKLSNSNVQIVTLKRKFFMWSGPHSKQSSNWGAPHRRLEHNSTRSDTGCLPATKLVHQALLHTQRVSILLDLLLNPQHFHYSQFFIRPYPTLNMPVWPTSTLTNKCLGWIWWCL